MSLQQDPSREERDVPPRPEPCRHILLVLHPPTPSTFFCCPDVLEFLRQSEDLLPYPWLHKAPHPPQSLKVLAKAESVHFLQRMVWFVNTSGCIYKHWFIY